MSIIFHNVEKEPFAVYGVFKKNGMYRRMPESVATSLNERIVALHTNTAGGRVRFQKDSTCIAIDIKMGEICRRPHFPLTGAAGLDMYVKENNDYNYAGTFVPPYDMEEGYRSEIVFEDKKMRDITINFPLYSDVKELYIGLEDDACIMESDNYTITKPIVYYGSSITQGGCASRPGNSYTSILSRRLDCDYICLGFSGNAKAEDEISQYIKQLDMSVFVYDYDHNAPSPEYLEETHEKMFKVIRGQHSALPIVIMSRPKYLLTKEEKIRLEIIKRTYENAVASGDEHVYFIDGRQLMDRVKAEGTVDNIHPNDLGFSSMAEALENVLIDILGGNENE